MDLYVSVYQNPFFKSCGNYYGSDSVYAPFHQFHASLMQIILIHNATKQTLHVTFLQIINWSHIFELCIPNPLIIDIPSINSNNLVDPPLLFSLFHPIWTITLFSNFFYPRTFFSFDFIHDSSLSFSWFLLVYRVASFLELYVSISVHETQFSPLLLILDFSLLLVYSNLTGSISRIIRALTFVRFVLPKNNYRFSLSLSAHFTKWHQIRLRESNLHSKILFLFEKSIFTFGSFSFVFKVIAFLLGLNQNFFFGILFCLFFI